MSNKGPADSGSSPSVGEQLVDFVGDLGAFMVSHPRFLEALPEIERVDEVAGWDKVRPTRVVAFFTGTVFHMGILVRVGGKPQLLHNWPGEDVTFDDLDAFPNPKTLCIVTYRQHPTSEDFNARWQAAARSWTYNKYSCNCEHFVSYVWTGIQTSYSVDRGLYAASATANFLSKYVSNK
jgi:hypothetical protein